MNDLEQDIANAISSTRGSDAAPAGAGGDVEAGISGTPGPTPDAGATAGDVSGEPSTPSVLATDSARSRDESGRFAKKAAAEAKAAAKVGGEVQQGDGGAKAPVKDTPGQATVRAGAPVTPAAEQFKAPQSWKPTAREHWPKMPPEVQAEVSRRERETATALQESAESRKFRQEFQQVVAPYMGQIRAEGGNELDAVANLMQTAQALRTAPPGHKAQLVASIIKQFGVPIDALDAALVGQAPPQGQAQQAQYRDPRVDQLFGVMQQRVQRSQQESDARAKQSVETFGQSHEFFEDVRAHMKILMMDAGERGVELSLEDAYNRACRMDDDVWNTIQRRKTVEAANASQASTQQARNAASSIRSQPTGSMQAPQSGSVMDDIRAAMAASSGR